LEGAAGPRMMRRAEKTIMQEKKGEGPVQTFFTLVRGGRGKSLKRILPA